jgi:membrane-associated phospholipid phosphatase
VTAGRQRAILAGVALMAFVGLVVLALGAKNGASAVSRLDVAWHESLRAYAVDHPPWLSSWRVVTHLGDTITVVLVDLALVGLCLVGGRRRLAVLVAVVGVAGWAARIAIRDLVARPRPTDTLWPETGLSFPSGHTTNATIAVGLAVIVLWSISRPRVRAVVLVITIAYAGGVGFSRIAGGVHWPSDVLGGFLLAVGILSAAMAVRPGGAGAGQRRGDDISP